MMSDPITCPKMCLPRLDASMFKATKFDDAAAKAKMGNAILSFIAKGMPQGSYTKAMYNRLPNMYGFIAHYNQDGFWGAKFETPQRRAEFLRDVVSARCYGDPEWTWCDVERAIAERVRDWRLVEAYEQAARRNVEASERRMLAHLQAKYHRAPVPAPSPMQSRIPVQASLL